MDNKFNYIEHVRMLRGRMMERMRRVFLVAGKEWGLKKGARREILRGAVVPAALYAAEVWGTRGCE